MLADTTKAPDEEVPDTGVGLEWERLLSSIFIESERYGTRSSTVLMVDRNRQATLVERSFDAGMQETRQSFDWSPRADNHAQRPPSSRGRGRGGGGSGQLW